jgi:hypothetical protein
MASMAGENGSGPLPGTISTGPEMREYDRYVAQKTWLDIDRVRNRVIEVSLGGVRITAKGPAELQELGAEVRGMLVSKAGGADIRVMVKAKVARLEGDGQTVGLEFLPMATANLKAVASLIQLFERLEIEAAFDTPDEQKKSPVWLRAAVAISVFSISVSFGALYLWIRG